MVLACHDEVNRFTVFEFGLHRNLFVEVLPLSGSNPAAIMLKELILEGKLHDLEARRAIAYMPFYLRLPSEKLLTSYEELLKENPKIQSKYDLQLHLILYSTKVNLLLRYVMLLYLKLSDMFSHNNLRFG